MPVNWVTDFLMPPFRDADTQENYADDALQMDLGALNEGTSSLVNASAEDAATQFWCDPGAYWDPTSCGDDMMGMENAFGGMCADLLMDSTENALPGLTALSQMRLQPEGLAQYSEDWRWRLPFSPLKLERDAEGTPRTESGDSGPDDDSTSASDLLVIKRSLRRKAGELGVVGSTGGSSAESANSSPWMVPSSQEPSWGPFGGAFDGLHSSLLTNSSLWDPSEPAKVTEVS